MSSLFSNTHSLCILRNVRHRVPHPYLTADEIIEVLRVSVFAFVGGGRETRRIPGGMVAAVCGT
jgi:hypothetical protein